MKGLLLLCGISAIFMLSWYVLKKIESLIQTDNGFPASATRHPSISIAFEHTEEVTFLNDLLEHFSLKSPSCELNLFYGSSNEIRRQLHNGKIDLGFIRGESDTGPDEYFDSFLLVLDEDVVACEPIGLPVIPLNKNKFLTHALWKKNNANPQVSLFISQLKADFRKS